MYNHIPMGKVQVQTLTQGHQSVMSKLTQDMDNVKTYLDDLLVLTNKTFYDHLTKLEMVLARLYLDDLLILTNNNFQDHLTKLDMVLARLSTAGMRNNAEKSKFFTKQIEYLGYWNYQKRIPTSTQ
jgi:hypothetical protein